jgi:hypothetical protein
MKRVMPYAECHKAVLKLVEHCSEVEIRLIQHYLLSDAAMDISIQLKVCHADTCQSALEATRLLSEAVHSALIRSENADSVAYLIYQLSFVSYYLDTNPGGIGNLGLFYVKWLRRLERLVKLL